MIFYRLMVVGMHVLKSFFSTALLLCALGINAQSSIPEDSLAEFCKKLPRPEYAKFERVDIDSEWYELYRVQPHVIAIYEPHQWQEAISYLILGQERALLFDTGNGIEPLRPVVESLTDMPVWVLNSHSHYDHVGANFEFVFILGMNTPFTRAKQQGRSNEEIRIEVSPPALCKQPPSGVSASTHIGRPYAINQTINDGHEIDLGGLVLKVVSTPGHTPDAIALHDPEHHLLFTGDTFYAGPIWLYEPETNLRQYRDSLQKLIELPNVQYLLPAHNTPWVDANILPKVAQAFDDMLDGKLSADPSNDDTKIYQPLNSDAFSFLMRDEPIQYHTYSNK